MSKLIGRPSSYTVEIADAICERLMEGESLRKICAGEGMPNKATVLRWAYSNEAFRDQYARAREVQGDGQFDEIIDIADDGSNDWMEVHHGESVSWKENGESLKRSQLRIDARKWVAGKLRPKVYGDKVTLAGDKENPLSVGGPTIIFTGAPEGASAPETMDGIINKRD